MTQPDFPEVVLARDSLLDHWQGHRRLTRRVIAAFPEDHLFNFSIGGMRSFGMLALECVAMGVPILRQIVADDWDNGMTAVPVPKGELLRRWDESTEEIDALWKQIPRGRFQETIRAFGQWSGSVSSVLLYVIDNEIHHRGQGYVYLRALGIQPPYFFDRD